MSSAIFRTFLQIQNTAGTNAKKEILRKNMSPIIRQIFEDTYGPQKYFIKKFVCPRSIGNGTLDDNYDAFHTILGSLACREVTGDEAYRQLQIVVAMYTPQDQEILCRIIDRNLKIGISLDNFLDVIGEKETKFEVALAMNLDKVKGVNPIDGTYYISRKLDGCRCICFVNKVFSDTWVEFKTRQNKIITTLENLVEPIKEFTKNLGPGCYVLDGEVCLMDDLGNEDFQGLMKEVTRKDHTIEKPRYNVFDLLTRGEFDGEDGSPNFADRLNMMHDLLTPNNNVVLLEQEQVTSQEVMDRWTNKAQNLGWEGCMLRKDAPYKRGRSKDLIKIKKFQDAEYIVEGIIEGAATYNEGGAKEYPVVAALIITHKGNQVKVGSGLSKEQRIGWLQNPEEIIGKTVTVQYFEETQDSKTGEYSLRFPVLKYVYDNERNV